MAEETLDHAITVAQLDHQTSVSRRLQIHGYHNHADSFGDLADYGSDAIEIQNMVKKNTTLGEKLPNSSVLKAEVIWAVRNEMARTVENFCARRRRLLILDARTSIQIAPAVAQLMAGELKKGKEWEKDQIEQYKETANRYFIH